MLFQWGEDSRSNGRCNGDRIHDSLAIPRDPVRFSPRDLISMPAVSPGIFNNFACLDAVRRFAHGFIVLIEIDCKAISATWS